MVIVMRVGHATRISKITVVSRGHRLELRAD